MRRLSVSVSTGRISAVFFEDQTLIGWRRSTETFANVRQARTLAERWIKGFGPDQLITESDKSVARKGPQSQCITKAIASTFASASGLDIRVCRTQRYENKYLEAQTLAERFAAAQSILPKPPPLWLPEPRDMGYFEAMALVVEVLPDATNSTRVPLQCYSS